MSATTKKRGLKTLPNGHSAGVPGGFIRVSHRLIRCEAFKALSGDALKALMALWTVHNGQNNGQIGFSVGEVQKALHCRRSRAVTVIDELEALRFIRCTAPAAQLGRLSRKWEISEEHTTSPNGRRVEPSLAARKMTAAEVSTALEGLKTKRQLARGGASGGNLEQVVKNKHRIPVGTAFVPPSEPQTVPNHPKPPLRTPVGTANDPFDPSLRTPVGTNLISTIPTNESDPSESHQTGQEKIAPPRPVGNSRVPVGFEQERARTLRMCDALLAPQLVEPRPAIPFTADQIHKSAQNLGIPRLPPAPIINGHASIGAGR